MFIHPSLSVCRRGKARDGSCDVSSHASCDPELARDRVPEEREGKALLKEPRRREPLMPRTRTGSGLLHELELGDKRDVVGKRRLTTRKWVIPADPELVAPDHGCECQTETLATVGVGNWVRDVAGDLDGFRVPLDRDLAVDADPIARVF